MTPTDPPSVATWLLKHLARKNEALAGDLIEEYRRRRSTSWYWRQALTAIVVSRSMAVLLTAGILGIYWLGHHIPIPGTSGGELGFLGRQTPVTMFQLYDLFNGGNFVPLTMFGLGIMPYVTASIFIQVLALLWRLLTRRTAHLTPRLMLQCTRFLAIVLCIVQANGIALFLERQPGVIGGLLVDNPGWVFHFTTVATLTCGATCLIWLSDYMTGSGIGNGMFLTFVAGLLVGLPRTVSTISQLPRAELLSPSGIFAFTVLIAYIGVVAITAHYYRRATQSVLPHHIPSLHQ